MVGSDLILISFETLWLSSLPAKMKKIRSKMKALEWPQYVDFSGAQGQITPKSVVRSGRNSNLFKFYACACYLQE